MYVIRDIFKAKPGQASKLARLFKDVSKDLMGGKVRVLTDAVGDYNTVIMETEVKDLAEHEKQMREYGDKPEFKQRMAGYTDMYLTGKREILRKVD